MTTISAAARRVSSPVSDAAARHFEQRDPNRPATQPNPMTRPMQSIANPGGPKLNRRHILKAAGVTLALPMLDYFQPRAFGAASAPPIRRMVCICTPLGLHPEFFFPEKPGKDYEVDSLPGRDQGFPRRLQRDLRAGASRGRREPRFDLQLSDRRPASRDPRRISQRDFARPDRGRARRRPDALPQPVAVRRRFRPVLDAQRRADSDRQFAVGAVRPAVHRRPAR